VTAIVCDGLAKRYGDIVAVDDVSFTVERGEVFVLLGRNGAGKTTTVEIIEGLREADDGTVEVFGKEPTHAEVRAQIGVMPQRGDLYAGIKTEEAVRLFASFYDEPTDPDDLLARLDLERVRRSTYRRLSGGEKRRLSLALALVGRPKVAFLDEPTSEMDVEGRATTWGLVRKMRDEGAAVVLTTHELDEVERLADRVGILREGRLVALGSPSELASDRLPEITVSLQSAIDTVTLASFLGTKIETLHDNTYRLTGAAPDPSLVSRLTTWLAARGVLVRTLRVGGRSLEEVYMELTR
jgi:ABC-2 type transport system ATP-binding protein